MAKLNYDATLVNDAIQELEAAKRELADVDSRINAACQTIASARGIEYVNYSAVAKASGVEVAPVDKDYMIEYVRKSGGKIIANKGATFYAVSMSVSYIVKALLSGIDTTMTVSTMMHGEYGVEDVCLSTLAIVGDDGVRCKIINPLTDEEVAALSIEQATEVKLAFSVGDEVNVIGGLFEGFSGVVQAISEDLKNVTVLVKRGNRDMPVELASDDVTLLESNN